MCLPLFFFSQLPKLAFCHMEYKIVSRVPSLFFFFFFFLHMERKNVSLHMQKNSLGTRLQNSWATACYFQMAVFCKTKASYKSIRLGRGWVSMLLSYFQISQ